MLQQLQKRALLDIAQSDGMFRVLAKKKWSRKLRITVIKDEETLPNFVLDAA